MPQTIDDARLLSNDVLARWLIEDFPFRIQLSSVFPFLPVAGSELRYATTGPLTPAATIDESDEIPRDTNRPSSPGRRHGFAEIATQFRVPYKAQDVFSSNVNDQVAVQTALAVRELLYKFWTLFEQGDTSVDPNEFDGLDRLVDPSNVLDLRGGELTLEALDEAKERVRANDGREVVVFTSSLGKRAIHAAHWIRGLPASYRTIDIERGDEVIEERVLAFDGAPVYVNDLNAVRRLGKGATSELISPLEVAKIDVTKERCATSIWFFVLGPQHLHGIVPENAPDIITRSTILADASSLVYHLTMPVSIALGSLGALSVIKDASVPCP